MQHDAFISYATKDKPTADAICHALEANGIRCWIAPRDIPLGQNYAETLVNAIHSAKLMVLVFSGTTNQSRHVRNEVERAFDKDIPVIPFRIENTPATGALEYFLSLPHWLDAYTPPLQKHLASLVESVSALLAAQGSQPTAAPAVAAPLPAATAPRGQGKATRPTAMLVGGAVVALLAIGGALLYFRPPAGPPGPVVAGQSGPPPTAGQPPVSGPPPTSAPPARSPAPTAQSVPSGWPEPDVPFPAPKPDREAALKILNAAAGAVNDDVKGDQLRLNTAEQHDMLAAAYIDLGERGPAIAQANKAVALSDVPMGDWFRNGTKIVKLSNAATVLWKAGAAEQARSAAGRAFGIWADSLKLPMSTEDQWIYGSPLIRALTTLGGKEDEEKARGVYRELEQMAERDKVRWSDQSSRAPLAIFVMRPIAMLTHSGQADEALTLAQSLGDPTARLYALNVLVTQLTHESRCDLAPKAAPAFLAVAGTDHPEFLTSFVSNVSMCQLADITLSTIDNIVRNAPASGGAVVDFPRLAAAAARVAAAQKAEELIGKANNLLASDQGSADACRGVEFAQGSVSGRVGLLAAYAALKDYGRASAMADDLLARTDRIGDPKAKLRCAGLVADMLYQARMWKKADEAALKGFSILQATPDDAGQDRKPRPDGSEIGERRIALALGQNGHFAEANQALMRTAGGLTELNRRELAVMAASRGDMAAAGKFVAGLEQNHVDYALAQTQIARALAGLSAED